VKRLIDLLSEEVAYIKPRWIWWLEHIFIAMAWADVIVRTLKGGGL
jgi:hypothetical protein